MLKCPSCLELRPAHLWDEATLKLCYNRKLRRGYVSITKNDVRKWYSCPACGQNFSRPKIKEVR